MSATLFSSKSQKSVRNYRKLLISSPLHVSPPTALLPTFSLNRTPGWTVVLRAKYSFEALCKPELSLHRGDHVRLLERPGNGWLKVQRIHEIGEGLVPALYLEITVNDPENPVSLEWLNDYQAPSSMRNRVAHVKVRCAYLSNSNNFWYRMDVTFNSQRQAYCAMFYEDFVSLHALYGSTALAGVFQIELPKNTPAVSPRLQNTMRSEAAAHAQTPMVASLDKFVQSLLRFAQCHSSNFLGDYIDNHCTRKVHVRSGETVPSDEVIASSLVDGSIKISLEGRFARYKSFSPTAPLPPVQGEPIGRADTLTYAPNAPYLASNMKYLS
ncbi:hypothetical protein METBIDRAFT_42540 [Metschnikowia bicuspidata var. bicuspidata NRRL YB-4993]|uniref:SH3 domain-containing protein n=1 Tax=Metschnikowia bicuspidata var. bicuspidata NRRL YB-4993 TaxID=869754 RepID=A0A1A0HC65_9ASCO|nr:hypothetical protein METBIDRAFT_42540 [Metschnikowia bicuspidata var. bicuspidata NRRL YB-4993]OBA21601.1 hypothetical protein METBIDRAFT_42540 [Metschnikowia bicuspidata var. bicuspidata NRRL YB-4993]